MVWSSGKKKKKYSAWSSKRKTFKVSGSLHRGKPRKHGLKERKVSKDIAKDRNAWKSFIRNLTANENKNKKEASMQQS